MANDVTLPDALPKADLDKLDTQLASLQVATRATIGALFLEDFREMRRAILVENDPELTLKLVKWEYEIAHPAPKAKDGDARTRPVVNFSINFKSAADPAKTVEVTATVVEDDVLSTSTLSLPADVVEAINADIKDYVPPPEPEPVPPVEDDIL